MLLCVYAYRDTVYSLPQMMNSNILSNSRVS